jgi:hypothetical protein
MKKLLIAALVLAPIALWAQPSNLPSPGGLGISLVYDFLTYVSGARQAYFNCGATVASGGTGTGIVNIGAGFTHSFTATANLTVPVKACGTMYNNIGATGAVTFSLPAAAPGLWYGFTVDAAQTVEVVGNGTDQIAIGASNSSSENVTASAAFATLVIYSYKAGQWVAVSSTGTWTVH